MFIILACTEAGIEGCDGGSVCAPPRSEWGIALELFLEASGGVQDGGLQAMRLQMRQLMTVGPLDILE